MRLLSFTSPLLIHCWLCCLFVLPVCVYQRRRAKDAVVYTGVLAGVGLLSYSYFTLKSWWQRPIDRPLQVDEAAVL